VGQRYALDVTAGLVLAVGAAAAAVWIIPEQAAPGDEGEIAPALLPTLAAAVVAVFALVQAISQAFSKSEGESEFDARDAVFALVATFGLAASVLVIMWMGFRVGGIIAIASVGFAMRPTRKMAIWLIVVALSLPLATYTLAWYGLRMALP
tara:strand:+ start:1071 stop:1523 length:453 start_codon:yes stop_codon:yes gene_type:complete